MVLEQASKCANLTHLTLDSCTQITEKGLATCRNMSSLHSLIINGATKISDQSISSVSIYCSNLHTLLLENCSALTDHAIRNVVGANARKVTSTTPSSSAIMIGGNPVSTIRKASPDKQILNKVSPVSTWLPAENASGGVGGIGLGGVLENLKLGNYGGATMLPNVVGLLSNCTCLRQLDLTKCAKLKDDNLIDAIRGSLSSNQPTRYNALGTLGTGIGATIRKLCLRECREITDQSLQCIATNCYKLRSIDLYNCQGITDEVYLHTPPFSCS